MEAHRDYRLCGHALQVEGGFEASGTVVKRQRLVEASGALDVYPSEEEAIRAGAEWARAWVAQHG
jgi:hypothetical protein